MSTGNQLCSYTSLIVWGQALKIWGLWKIPASNNFMCSSDEEVSRWKCYADFFSLLQSVFEIYRNPPPVPWQVKNMEDEWTDAVTLYHPSSQSTELNREEGFMGSSGRHVQETTSHHLIYADICNHIMPIFLIGWWVSIIILYHLKYA